MKSLIILIVLAIVFSFVSYATVKKPACVNQIPGGILSTNLYCGYEIRGFPIGISEMNRYSEQLLPFSLNSIFYFIIITGTYLVVRKFQTKRKAGKVQL